ncbi:mitotic fidelity of chromosome transmission-related protein [Pleosporales sp. CAS-2024a]
MAPQRKREGRQNQFYNVGVQGRKTGITLTDRGVYDEHGLEPISGIFSSPEKSPPKRGDTATASESMDLQESSIPELTTAHQILRNSRTHLPPPRSRSPKKTALGSSPRRQSSMAPRGSSIGVSSPLRAASHPAVARRLDFDQEDSSLQETPALSGSGQRRGQRTNVYDIPEDESPVPQILEESFMQEEITANENSTVFHGVAEETTMAQLEDDAINGAENVEDLMESEASQLTPEPVKEPARRGKKRKSEVLEPAEEEAPSQTNSRRRGETSAHPLEHHKKSKEPVTSRRSKRVSDMAEQSDQTMSVLEESQDASAPAKKRGRPPRTKLDAQENTVASKSAKPAASKKVAKDDSVSSKPTKSAATTSSTTEVFKKPPKPAAKPKDKSTAKSKDSTKPTEAASDLTATDAGKLVDMHGHPLNKKDLEQMSVASTTSRYGRGRHLSVFRELEPEAVARVGRTGRHRVAPIDFWKNDRIAYDSTGSMTSIVKNQDVEPERRPHKASGSRSRKRNLAAIEEEEIELDPWEEEDGVFVGNYRKYDAVAQNGANEVIEGNIAWAQKGVQPDDVADGTFGYAKLAAEEFFNWGVIELRPEQMKRTKNSRRMHMVFSVQSGTLEVKVHENEFTVHKNGIWQVPRGNLYSIKNIGSGTARVFFAQAREISVNTEE